MKNRNGFVSNSSSVSFMIPKSRITEKEILALMAYNVSEFNTDGWTIIDDDDCLRGFTIMDNDVLDEYLETIGIDQQKMEWHDSY